MNSSHQETNFVENKIYFNGNEDFLGKQVGFFKFVPYLHKILNISRDGNYIIILVYHMKESLLLQLKQPLYIA